MGLVSIREAEEMRGGFENSPVLSVWSGKKGSGMTTELMSYFLLNLARISHRHISSFFFSFFFLNTLLFRCDVLPSIPLKPIFIYLYPGLWPLPKRKKKKKIYFPAGVWLSRLFRSPLPLQCQKWLFKLKKKKKNYILRKTARKCLVVTVSVKKIVASSVKTIQMAMFHSRPTVTLTSTARQRPCRERERDSVMQSSSFLKTMPTTRTWFFTLRFVLFPNEQKKKKMFREFRYTFFSHLFSSVTFPVAICLEF